MNTSYLRLEGHVLNDSSSILIWLILIRICLFFSIGNLFFSIEKKTFDLALGMGPNIGPVRALEKGLIMYVKSHIHKLFMCYIYVFTEVQPTCSNLRPDGSHFHNLRSIHRLSMLCLTFLVNEEVIIMEIAIDGALMQVGSEVIGRVCLHSNAMGCQFLECFW